MAPWETLHVSKLGPTMSQNMWLRAGGDARSRGDARSEVREPFGSLCGASLGTDDNLMASPSLALTVCILHPVLQGCTRWGQGCAWSMSPPAIPAGPGREQDMGWQRWAILQEHQELATAEQ